MTAVQVSSAHTASFYPELREYTLRRPDGRLVENNRWSLWQEVAQRSGRSAFELWNLRHYLADRSLLALFGEALQLRSTQVFEMFGHGGLRDRYGACSVQELMQRVAQARGFGTGEKAVVELRKAVGPQEIHKALGRGHYPDSPKMQTIDGRLVRTYPVRLDVAIFRDGHAVHIYDVEQSGVYRQAVSFDGKEIEIDLLPIIMRGDFYVPYPFAQRVLSHTE